MVGKLVTLFLAVLISSNDIPQAKQTKEPPVVAKMLAETVCGYYKISGKTREDKIYSGIVSVQRPPQSQIYVISQTVGTTTSKGIGIIVEERLVVSWQQNDILGVTAVRFTGRNGLAKWSSIPGNGQLAQEDWNFLAEIGGDDD